MTPPAAEHRPKEPDLRRPSRLSPLHRHRSRPSRTLLSVFACVAGLASRSGSRCFLPLDHDTGEPRSGPRRQRAASQPPLGKDPQRLAERVPHRPHEARARLVLRRSESGRLHPESRGLHATEPARPPDRRAQKLSRRLGSTGQRHRAWHPLPHLRSEIGSFRAEPEAPVHRGSLRHAHSADERAERLQLHRRGDPKVQHPQRSAPPPRGLPSFPPSPQSREEPDVQSRAPPHRRCTRSLVPEQTVRSSRSASMAATTSILPQQAEKAGCSPRLQSRSAVSSAWFTAASIDARRHQPDLRRTVA